MGGKGGLLGRSGVPSLASDEVTLVASPRDGVFTASLVGVGDITGTVGPERVVVTAVSTSRAGCARAREQFTVVPGDGKSSGREGQGGEEERREADHGGECGTTEC